MKAHASSARPPVPSRLGDYSVRPRILLIGALALAVGAVSAVVAQALLKLIGLITNVVFYQRLESALVAPGFWALMSLAAVVGGVMRSPLTGIVFAMELTHQWDAVMPLVVSSTVAFLLSVLVLRRSVLTEKVVRKGTHLTREYSVDPLEVFLVSELMPRSFLCFRGGKIGRASCRETV